MTLAVFKRVGRLAVVNKRLNELAGWSEILFLNSKLQVMIKVI